MFDDQFEFEFGYYGICAYEHCKRYYYHFDQNAPTRRPVESLIRAVVGDALHKVIEARVPEEGEEAARQQIEKRLPPQYHKEARTRAKKHMRFARTIANQFQGKSVRKTFRWYFEEGGHGVKIYTTPDRNRENGNTITIVEAKSGRGEVVKDILWDHLRFHGIVAASAFDAEGKRPNIHLLGYMPDRDESVGDNSLVQIGEQAKGADLDLTGLEPTFDFWYSWHYLESEQEEIKNRIRPILDARKAGLFPAEPNDQCPKCDYLWTTDCTEGQEHVRLLQARRERRVSGLVTLGDVVAPKPPQSVSRSVNGEFEQSRRRRS